MTGRGNKKVAPPNARSRLSAPGPQILHSIATAQIYVDVHEKTSLQTKRK